MNVDLEDAPKPGGHQAEKLLEAWLLKNGFKSIDRRRGATGLAMVERDGELHHFSQKRDYFGCIDVSGSNDDLLWLIQVTTKAGLAKRRKKVASITWPKRAVLSGCLRLSVFEHRIVGKRGREWLHEWVAEDYRPVTINEEKDWGFIPEQVGWKFVSAGIFQFTESDLARAPDVPLSESIKMEACRIAALPKAEREAAINAVAAERKKARRAKK